MLQIVAIVISLALTAWAVVAVTLTVRRMTAVMRAGQPAVGRTDEPLRRTVTMFKETFGHTRMLQWTWVGIMHWFVYLAFIVLSTAVATAYVQLFKADFVLPIIGHWYPVEWILELLGLELPLSTAGAAAKQQRHCCGCVAAGEAPRLVLRCWRRHLWNGLRSHASV